MHQDQRIGLALAVLLVGAAGAFFFRNDPKPSGRTQRLKTAREIDARIAEKQVSPYLQSDDDDELLSARKPTNSTKSRTSNAPDLLNSSDNAFPGIGEEVSPIPIEDSRSTSDIQASDRDGSRTNKPAGGERVHIVQKGETLSSIAAKELGSSGRFSDIYEANRDQLNDANDVRIGMSLRIPTRDGSRSENGMTSRTSRSSVAAPPLLPSNSDRSAVDFPSMSDPDDVSNRNSSEPTPRKKFEPSKRAIPAPAADSSRSPRKLSQMPPKDATGKVAR